MDALTDKVEHAATDAAEDEVRERAIKKLTPIAVAALAIPVAVYFGYLQYSGNQTHSALAAGLSGLTIVAGAAGMLATDDSADARAARAMLSL